MCESYFLVCSCGANRAELFFGKMLLDRTAVRGLFCPHCSDGVEAQQTGIVWDNGWILELDMDVIRQHASSFSVDREDLTAEWIFDSGYVTWVGITPDDSERRNREREQIQHLAKTDMLAYIQAMKDWGRGRERRFSEEGWRKMVR